MAGGNSLGDGVHATNLALVVPEGICCDAEGNLYISDTGNHVIRKLGSDGISSIVAGNGIAGYSGDGGPAVSASLRNPSGLCVDESGNLYIADRENHRIRKVDTEGVMTTIAGNGTAGYSGDEGDAIEASLNQPAGLCMSAGGELYIADKVNNRIRKVDSGGTITTVAGNGQQGPFMNGMKATQASLNHPTGVSLDEDENLYIADSQNNWICRVNSSGMIHIVAGTGGAGFQGDTGKAVEAKLNRPGGVFVNQDGSLFIADGGNNRIRKVDDAGSISTVAGNGLQGYQADEVDALSTALCTPAGIWVNGAGELYIADTYNHRIRKVDSNGVITTIAGKGAIVYTGDGDVAAHAALKQPSGGFPGGDGKVYIADKDHHRVRMLNHDGIITTVTGNGIGSFYGDGGSATGAYLNSPNGIFMDSMGNLFIADTKNNRIRKVDSAELITTVAGNGVGGYNGDNCAATSASLNHPTGVWVDGEGNFYIADCNNHRIRMVDPEGIITTIAGTGTAGYSGDGAKALNASLHYPTGVCLDEMGNLYIADRDNHRIRMLDNQGIITTVAGNGSQGYDEDGCAATSTSLNHPTGVYVDGEGNLYIADSENHRIRMVNAEGIITTVAGNGTPGFSGDGAEAANASLWSPQGVWGDDTGIIYIADTLNHRIRVVEAALYADAGEDADTDISQSVTLSGSGSGGDGRYSYLWSIESGPSLLPSQFSDLASGTAVFTPTAPGVYVLSLTVTDGSGASASDTVQITVTGSLHALWLEHMTDTILVNQEFELVVKYEDGTGLIGYRLVLQYDPSQLEYVSDSATTDSTSVEDWADIEINYDSDHHRIIITSAGSESLPSGEATLLRLRMKVLQGVSDGDTLTISFTDLTSLNDGALEFEPQTWSQPAHELTQSPDFTPGADPEVLEDGGTVTIASWATDISSGLVDETGLTLDFVVSVISNASLFSVPPVIDSNGTLVFTPAANAYGVATAEVYLQVHGDHVPDGYATSDTHTFSITVVPVNDAPTLTLLGDQSGLEDSGVQSVSGFASASPGPDNESHQTLSYQVSADNPSLFSMPPAIDADGTLTYTPAADAHGSSTVTVQALDDGGTANGGKDTSPAATCTITITPVNDAPSFDVIPDQEVLEDCGTFQITVTGMEDGDPEVKQTLTLKAISSDEGILENPVITDTNESQATVTFTSLQDMNGTVTLTITLTDDGGTENGGIDSFTQTCQIHVKPVNDAPSFVAGPDLEVLNENGDSQTFSNWAGSISAGPENESNQNVSFVVTVKETLPVGLDFFNGEPAISADGNLEFILNPGVHGVVILQVYLADDGGTADSGVNVSPSEEIRLTVFQPFLWGDLNADDLPGAVDASLVLQHNVGLIDSFPGYPPDEYPEYYPDPVNMGTAYPPAADVSHDGLLGTMDASYLLKHFALLITHFPSDINQDGIGPDAHGYAKTIYSQHQAERTLRMRVDPEEDDFRLTVSLDDAAGVCGLQVGMRYDPQQLVLLEDSVQLEVPGGLLAVNARDTGKVIVSGALISPLEAGEQDLLSLKLRKGNPGSIEPVYILLEEQYTHINDGQVALLSDSFRALDLENPTSVDLWMMY
ncbi:MAG: PKD domain-containing protein [bacterium]